MHESAKLAFDSIVRLQLTAPVVEAPILTVATGLGSDLTRHMRCTAAYFVAASGCPDIRTATARKEGFTFHRLRKFPHPPPIKNVDFGTFDSNSHILGYAGSPGVQVRRSIPAAGIRASGGLLSKAPNAACRRHTGRKNHPVSGEENSAPYDKPLQINPLQTTQKALSRRPDYTKFCHSVKHTGVRSCQRKRSSPCKHRPRDRTAATARFDSGTGLLHGQPPSSGSG